MTTTKRTQISRRNALKLAAGGLTFTYAAAAQAATTKPGPAASLTHLRFPKGAIIRLVLGDVRPEELSGGPLLFHEHPLFRRYVSPPGATMTDEEQLALMVDELKQAKEDGVGCVFDAGHLMRTPQQFEYARQLSLRSGLPIGLAGARDSWLPTSMFPEVKAWWGDAMAKGETRMVEETAADMVRESKEQRWAAVGEIGTGLPPSEIDLWYLKAAAKVHHATNLSIFTHVPSEGCPPCAVDQLALYESLGVDPRRICLGHVDQFSAAQDPGWKVHQQLAKRGAWLGFDGVGAPHELPNVPIEANPDNKPVEVTSREKIKMLLQLLDAGFEDQILFATDTSRDKNLKANYGGGFSTLITQFFPKLRHAGVDEKTIRKIAVDNPRRFFAFVPKPA